MTVGTFALYSIDETLTPVKVFTRSMQKPQSLVHTDRLCKSGLIGASENATFCDMRG